MHTRSVDDAVTRSSTGPACAGARAQRGRSGRRAQT